MKRNLRVAAALMVGLLGLLGSAQAQSVSGVVTDASGALLPGVTVQASSDISAPRPAAVVTNGDGAYEITGLVPGTYMVTFTLAGFQPAARTSLVLSSGVAMAVYAGMNVGSVSECCCVESSSRLIDTQSNVTSYVISRNLLDELPTDHTLASISLLVPSVIVSSPEHPVLSVHGSAPSDTVITLDGMIVSGLQD